MNRSRLGGAALVVSASVVALGAGFLVPDRIFLIAAIVAVAAAIVVIRRPWIGVAIIVCLIPFNGLLSQLLGDGALSTALGAVKDGILLILLLVALVTTGLRRVPVEIVVLVTITVTVGAISGIWTASPEQAAYGWRNDFEPLLLLIAVPALLDGAQVRRISGLMIGAAQVAALITVLSWSRGVQWLLDIGRLPVAEGERFPDALFVSGSLNPRGFSPYTAPNEMAVSMGVVVALIWCRAEWTVRRRVMLSALPIVAILLSQSRSGLLGLLVLGVVFIAWHVYRSRPGAALGFLTMAGVGVGALAVYTNDVSDQISDSSLIGHADSLSYALTLLVEHPLGAGVGSVGPRAYLYDPEAIQVESFWLLLAIESSLLVLGLFVALLIRIVARSLAQGTLGSFLGAAAVGVSLVSQLVLPTLQEGAVSFTLWTVVGFALVHAREDSAPRIAATTDAALLTRRVPSLR